MKGDGGGFLNFLPKDDLIATGQINHYRMSYRHVDYGKNFYVDRITAKVTNDNPDSSKKCFITYAVPKGEEIINPADVIKYQYKIKENGEVKTITKYLDEIGKGVDVPMDAVKIEASMENDPEGILDRQNEFDFYAYEVDVPSARVLNFSVMDEEEIEMWEMDGYADGDLVPTQKSYSLYVKSEGGTCGEFGLWILGSFGGGTGVSGDEYEIETWEHLDNVRTELSSSFIMMNNLGPDDTGYDTYASSSADGGDGWLPLGDSGDRFEGTFDGQGYEIKGLYIDRPATNYTGLFGYVDTGGEVSNVGVVDADMSGDLYAGGLVGGNRGTVDNSYATGSVSGGNYVGGLVGRIWEGTVDNSYATGSVSGEVRVGGLVGENRATVDNSYARGDVTRLSGTYTDFGGFVGLNYQGKILNSYSTGNVTYEGAADPTDKGFAGNVDTGGDYEITNCFWDTETSGQTTTAGDATGKTTAEMMDISTFNDTATGGLTTPWDIVETYIRNSRNTDYIWNILNNKDYPHLSWEAYKASVWRGKLPFKGRMII